MKGRGGRGLLRNAPPPPLLQFLLEGSIVGRALSVEEKAKEQTKKRAAQPARSRRWVQDAQPAQPAAHGASRRPRALRGPAPSRLLPRLHARHERRQHILLLAAAPPSPAAVAHQRHVLSLLRRGQLGDDAGPEESLDLLLPAQSGAGSGERASGGEGVSGTAARAEGLG